MKRLIWRANSILLLLFLAASLIADDKRLPVPEEATQEELRKLARDIYQDEYKAAETAKQKSALAQEIIKNAVNKEDDPATKYVLLRLGADVAALGGDTETAFDAAETLCNLFQLDELKMKVALIGQLTKTVRTSDQQGQLAESLLPLIDKVLMADEYGTAQSMTSATVRHAKRTKDKDLIKNALAKEREVQKVLAAYRGIAKHLATLEAEPADPSANSAVGRFYCFVRGDWATGVPMLALGNDEQLSTVAGLDIANPTIAVEQANLADRWWKLATEMKEPKVKSNIKSRAAHWYQRAVEGLTGLSKTKAVRRLEEFASMDTKPKSDDSRVVRDRRSQPAVLLLRAHIEGHERVRIDASSVTWIRVVPKYRMPTNVSLNGRPWNIQGAPTIRISRILPNNVDFSAARLVKRKVRGRVTMNVEADHLAIDIVDTPVGGFSFELLVVFPSR
jgi:hypothetical protein